MTDLERVTLLHCGRYGKEWLEAPTTLEVECKDISMDLEGVQMSENAMIVGVWRA